MVVQVLVDIIGVMHLMVAANTVVIIFLDMQWTEQGVVVVVHQRLTGHLKLGGTAAQVLS